MTTPPVNQKDMPQAVQGMLEKWNRNREPHERKTIEVATLIRATSINEAVWCLEELISRLKESGVGWKGHGCGRNSSMAWCSVDLKEGK